MGGSSQTQQSTAKEQSSNRVTPYAPAQSGINDILNQARGVQPFDFSGAMSGLQDSINSFSEGQLPAGLLASIEDSVTNTVGDQFAKSGRSFSGDFVNAMTKQLVNSEAPYGMQGYGMLPSLTQTAANLPYAGLQGKSNLILPIASAFNRNKGNSNTIGNSTTEMQNNPWQTGVGAGLGLLGLGMSPMGGGSSLFGSLFG